jgi:hypothetical protein
MVTTLVNGYLAFEYITEKELRLQESTNRFALALVAIVRGVGWWWVVTMTHGARQAAVEAHAAGADLDYLPHALFNGRAFRFNASSAEGRAGCASTCKPMVDARLALPVSIWTGRRLSGSSNLETI